MRSMQCGYHVPCDDCLLIDGEAVARSGEQLRGSVPSSAKAGQVEVDWEVSRRKTFRPKNQLGSLYVVVSSSDPSGI